MQEIKNFQGYNIAGETQTLSVVIDSLSNGHEKYAIIHNGQRVQGGVVKTSATMNQVKSYCKRMGIKSLFAV